MQAKNLENLVKKERLEGRQEGRQEGERNILRKLLVFKFGPLPSWAEEQLQIATSEQLEGWSEQVLVADSLEALLTH